MQRRKRKIQDISGGAPEKRVAFTKRKHTPLMGLLKFLEDSIMHPPKMKKVPPIASRFGKLTLLKNSRNLNRKEHSLESQALVIFLRFGSL